MKYHTLASIRLRANVIAQSLADLQSKSDEEIGEKFHRKIVLEIRELLSEAEGYEWERLTEILMR